VGRLVPIKGIFVALHTLKELLSRGIPATLDIAGDGDQKQAAQQCAMRLGIHSSVRWHGCVGNVQSLYDAIDILLIPSLREPLGLVALEAAARGVPSVAASVDGLTESVLHNQTGICIPPTLPINIANGLLAGKHGIPTVVVDPTSRTLVSPKLLDPKQCADAVQKLISEPSLYSSYSQSAIAHAKSRSDFDGYFHQIQAILGRVTQEATPSTLN
jgi:glycosyltransferase involved in cell wall biosynthesis